MIATGETWVMYRTPAASRESPVALQSYNDPMFGQICMVFNIPAVQVAVALPVAATAAAPPMAARQVVQVTTGPLVLLEMLLQAVVGAVAATAAVTAAIQAAVAMAGTAVQAVASHQEGVRPGVQIQTVARARGT
jgi:hypothetical protein